MLENKEEISKNNKNHADELDLISRIKPIWIGRKKIIKITIIFAIIGLFIAVFSETEYTASTTMVPQTGTARSIGGSLAGLAGIAGINIGTYSSNDSGVSPLLYPHIINSISFQKELLGTPLTIEGYDASVTLQEYYTNIYRPGLLSIIKKYTIGLPGVLIRAIKGKPTEVSLKSIDSTHQILQITAAEKKIIEQLKKQMTLSVNENEGYISLSSIMPDALNAAELTRNGQELLQKYIINFKVEKSKEQLRFIQERYSEKEKEFKKIQKKLALYQDRNQFLNSALAQNTLIRYQAEYNLAFVVFSDLAKQQEAQQIKVKEETPIFTILEPVSIPIENSKPRKGKILLIWTFLGFIIGVTLVFTKSYISRFKNKIKYLKTET
jgi:uncharacterized protein involved in exopolysaccharide biosynthesis